MIDALTTQAASQLVPASYAEKAMASLMQLHSELMDEKEKRVELFRQLMAREQALAELKMYVKLLEERAAPAPVGSPVPAPVAAAVPPRPVVQARRPAPLPPVPPPPPLRARVEGWKTW